MNVGQRVCHLQSPSQSSGMYALTLPLLYFAADCRTTSLPGSTCGNWAPSNHRPLVSMRCMKSVPTIRVSLCFVACAACFRCGAKRFQLLHPNNSQRMMSTMCLPTLAATFSGSYVRPWSELTKCMTSRHRELPEADALIGATTEAGVTARVKEGIGNDAVEETTDLRP